MAVSQKQGTVYFIVAQIWDFDMNSGPRSLYNQILVVRLFLQRYQWLVSLSNFLATNAYSVIL